MAYLVGNYGSLLLDGGRGLGGDGLGGGSEGHDRGGALGIRL
jgi:hypothetical protein